MSTTAATIPAPARSARWRWVKRIVGTALAAAAVGAAISKRHELAQAAKLLSHLNWGWLAVAIAFEVGSLVAFARLQRWLLLAGDVEVGLRSMVEIILAGNALSMSLPGGAAWAAAWAFGQLRRRGADRVLAAWVVLVAGALASFALFLLMVAGALLAGSHGPASGFRLVGIGLAAIPLVAGLLALAARRFPSVRRELSALWRRLARIAAGERLEEAATAVTARVRAVQPSALAWAEAFGLALLNWLESCACLVACILAVHGHVPWRGILVAYALTQVLASIPLTPGGIGVVEGGLTALLVAYGMPTQVALASVLLFRVVSFWGLVPIGWMAWAALTLPGRAAERDRPHPWAPHRHRHGAPVEHDPSRAPDRVFPPEPCVGCD